MLRIAAPGSRLASFRFADAVTCVCHRALQTPCPSLPPPSSPSTPSAPSASAFKQQMRSKQSKTLTSALTELKESAVTPDEIAVAGRIGMYQTLYDQYLNEKETMIEWSKISPPCVHSGLIL